MRRFIGALEFAFSDMHRLSRLKALSLGFWPTWRSESASTVKERCGEFVSRQSKLLEAVYNSKPSPALKSLTITNLCLLHPRPDRRRRNPRLSIISQLSDITLILLSNAEHAQLAEGDGRPVVHGPRDYLPPSHSRLDSLTLRSPRGLFHTHDLCPHGLIYPHLTSISLENIVLGRPSSTGSMISFILSHKTTLRRLELTRCSIIVTDNTDDSLRYWSHIWDRFSKDLTSLSELKIVQSSSEQTKTSTGYTMFVEDKELEMFLLSPMRSKTDDSALERFQRVVKQRT